MSKIIKMFSSPGKCSIMMDDNSIINYPGQRNIDKPEVLEEIISRTHGTKINILSIKQEPGNMIGEKNIEVIFEDK